MRKFLLILITLIPVICFGQINTDSNDDSLLIKKQLFMLKNFGYINTLNQESPSRGNKYDLYHPNGISVPESYRLTILPEFQRDIFLKQFILDDNFTNQYILNSSNSITTSHMLSNFMGLGQTTTVGADYNFNLSDIGVFSAGVYGAKYNIYNVYLDDGGFNGNIKIYVSNGISLNLFGQYSYTESKFTMSPLISPLYPYSNYGASLEFRFNNKWGLSVGSEYEYDAFKQKWLIRPFIMPLFFKYPGKKLTNSPFSSP